MTIGELITRLNTLRNLHGDLDVLTRGSQPQKMMDVLEVRKVKTTTRTAVFVGKPKTT